MAKSKSSGVSLDDSWRAESDLRTLIEAQVIRNDPRRLKKAMAKAKEQAAALEEAMEPPGLDDEKGEKGEK